MEQAFVKLLDENLECIDYKLKNDTIIFLAKSVRRNVCCPYCGFFVLHNSLIFRYKAVFLCPKRKETRA